MLFWFSMLLIVVCTIVVALLLFRKDSSMWSPLWVVKECKKIQSSNILEITSQKTTDSAEWTVFDDDDLIQKWTNYLEQVEVKHLRSVSQADGNENGGKPVIRIKTETNEVVLCMRSISGIDVFEIGDDLYSIKSQIENPFSETYDMSVKRHGVRSPWD